MNWLRYIWTVLRTYDEYEYLCCADCDWKLEWTAVDRKTCPECGGEVQVQLPRREALELLRYDLRTSIFPQRLYTWSKGDTTTLTWVWRGRVLFSREIKNPFKR